MKTINKGRDVENFSCSLHGGQQNSEHSCLKLNSSIVPRSVFFILSTTHNYEKFFFFTFLRILRFPRGCRHCRKIYFQRGLRLYFYFLFLCESQNDEDKETIWILKKNRSRLIDFEKLLLKHSCRNVLRWHGEVKEVTIRTWLHNYKVNSGSIP